MSEKEEMVVPRSWNYVHRTADEYLNHSDDSNNAKKFYSRIVKNEIYSKRICYLVHNEVVVERCEYRVNGAVCYSGRTNNKLRAFKVDFFVCDAMYSKMEDGDKMADYLVLVGDDQLAFWQVESGSHCVVSVPFRIERVYPSDVGILIERARVIGDENSGDIDCHIFSLVHPFNEILPVLYKNGENEPCYYAFSKQHVTLIPSNSERTGNFFLGYDGLKEKHLLYTLRRCTDAEKAEASRSLQSFISHESPGYFSINASSRSGGFRNLRGVGSMNSTPASSFAHSRSSLGTGTPVRRSTRSRQRQKANQTLLSEAASYKSSLFSYRPDSSIRSVRNTFRVFNLDGEEMDELDVDFIFVGLWEEKLGFDGILTPLLASTNLTPKSILSRRDSIKATANKDSTPVRSVKFVEKDAQENDNSHLRHKQPAPVTPGAPLSFKEASIGKTISERSTDADFDWGNFNNYSNERLLAALDELIARHRNTLLQKFLPKDAPKKQRKKKPITAEDYIKVRTSVMKFYARLMQSKLHTTGCKNVKAFYALQLYRKEVWQIVRNQTRSKAANYKHIRAATRFFLTKDMAGQKYVCFLPGGENKLNVIKWDTDKNDFASMVSIEASDAVNVMGNKMIAILRTEKSTVSLYTGSNEIGTLSLKPFRQSSHELLQLIDSYEKSIIVKIQHKKRLFVQTVLFDLDFTSSQAINRLFDSIFASLPLDKAVKFFSSWCSINHLDECGAPFTTKKSLFIELPLMVQHFFASFGLQIKNLTCSELIDNLRQAELSPKIKKERKELEDALLCAMDDSIEEESDEIPFLYNFEELLKNSISRKENVIVCEAKGRENFIGNHAFQLFEILHMMFESFNIFLNGRKYKLLLLEPLYVFAKIAGLQKYIDHYSSFVEELRNLQVIVEKGTILPTVKDVESIVVNFNVFLRHLKSRCNSEPPSIPNNPHWPTKILLCAIVACGKIQTLGDVKHCLGSQWQKRLQLTSDSQKTFLTIFSSNRCCSYTKCSRLFKLFSLSAGDIHVLESSLAKVFDQIVDETARRLEKDVRRGKLKVFPSDQDQNRWIKLQWPTDIRLTNVNQMLDSNRQILIPVRRAEDDTLNREQYNLFLVSTYGKQVAKAFGRASIGFKTVRAPNTVDSCQVPKIELSGRVPPNHVFHEFPNGEISKSMNDWADFMAGAAHTLTLTHADTPSFYWLRQWNSTHRSIAVTAGCIYAYGLAGRFNNVNVHEVHQMLVKFKKSYESVSIFLGAAVTYRGTSHLDYFRMLATHIPFFLEPTLVELKFDAIVQIGCILGVGFLFLETINLSYSNRIINEMAKETFFDGENEGHRYSYVLSCGISVGLINLGQGVNIRNSEVPAADGNYEIEERLLVLLEGGLRMMCTDFGRKNSSLCRVQRIGAAALSSVSLPPSASACTTIDFAALHGIGVNPEPNGMATTHNEVNRHTANSMMGTLAKESSTTRELSNVNIHITPPGACIALALMYLKTGDEYIIRKLCAPTTLPEIETTRPDVLMLRTLCTLMVDYNNVSPDYECANQRIPEIIRKYVAEINTTSWWLQNVDIDTIAESYFYIKCGICLAIGIRYASTYNEQAVETITNFFNEVDPNSKQSESSKVRQFVKSSVTSICAAIAVYSLSLVMAGSGDLETLRIIRKVRNHLPEHLAVENDPFTYGVQTYCNTALGFLFLGNARYGFSHSNEAIAMLLISSYPILPQSICDQKHYFQPMRFLWSLATEYRYLIPIDEDTHEPVRMQAKITIANAPKSASTMVLKLPAVLPPLESINSITFCSRDYNESELDMTIDEEKMLLMRTLHDFYGRYPVRKVMKCYSNVFDSSSIFRISDTHDFKGISPDYQFSRLNFGN